MQERPVAPTNAKPGSSETGRASRPITKPDKDEHGKAALPESSSLPQAAAPPLSGTNPNEVIDLRKLNDEAKITRVQPPKPESAKRGSVSGSSFKIDDFDLAEVIAQDDANMRQPSLAQEAPKPTPAANLTDRIKADKAAVNQPMSTKPDVRSVESRLEPDLPKNSAQPAAPGTPKKSESLRAPESKPDSTRPTTHLKPEPKPNPSVEPATPPKAAPSKAAKLPDTLSSKLLTDAPPERTDSSTAKLEEPASPETQAVSFSAKPTKPEGKANAAELGNEASGQKEITASHNDTVEIYSLKQALKKLKPKDEPVSGDEES